MILSLRNQDFAVLEQLFKLSRRLVEALELQESSGNCCGILWKEKQEPPKQLLQRK